MQERPVPGYAQHVVRHLQKVPKLPDEGGRPLSPLEEGLQRPPPDAPRLANLQAGQTSLAAPAVDRDPAHPQISGDFPDAHKVLVPVRAHIYHVPRFRHVRRLVYPPYTPRFIDLL